MGSFFGGSPGTSTSTSFQELSPEQRELIDLALPAARGLAEQPPELFPDSAIIGPSALQEQAQQGFLDVATSTLPGLTTAATGAGAELLSGGRGVTAGAGVAQAGNELLAGGIRDPNVTAAQTALLDPNSVVGSNPFLDRATAAALSPLYSTFQQQILPGIRNEAVAAGGFGGSRQGIAEGMASQDLLRQVGDTTANIQSNAFNQQLNAMVNALGVGAQREGSAAGTQLGAFRTAAETAVNEAQLANQALTQGIGSAGTIGDLAMFAPQILEGVGTQAQQRAQALRTEEVQRFQAEQLLPFTVAQDIAALAFGMPGGRTSATSAVNPPSNTLGDLASLAAIFGAFI